MKRPPTIKQKRRRTAARSRPFVLINMAMTADGKTATANRALSSFGSPKDHNHLLELRATADAVMAGARTVDLNWINLGPGGGKYLQSRARRGLQTHNVRIIVSRLGTVDPKSRVFRERFSPVLVLVTRLASAKRIAALKAVAHEVKFCGATDINFPLALRWLFEQWNIRRLVCEGGGELNDALFQANLVDELHLTVCPWIFAGRAAPTIADGAGAAKLARAAEFQLKSARRVGDELLLRFTKSQGQKMQQSATKRRAAGAGAIQPSGRAARANPKGD